MNPEMEPLAAQKAKQVFLCHASEDKPLARKIAHSLQASGIETFFDEWEMRAGDSLRQKIDAGLLSCTHFVALLTPRSIHKPWVEAEMDAAFVRKVEGQCRFIPLRSELSVNSLPPLLAALLSPEIGGDYNADIARLVSDIYEISRRPPLGPIPDAAVAPLGLEPEQTGLSISASRIAEALLRESKDGMSFDPELSVEKLREITGLTDDDIQDGAEELEGLGLIRLHRYIGCGPLGFGGVFPEDRLFVALDAQIMGWDPQADALRLAADLNANPEGTVRVSELAEQYGWPARRLNPAVSYLDVNRLATVVKTIGTAPFTAGWIRKTSATRRFVRDNS